MSDTLKATPDIDTAAIRARAEIEDVKYFVERKIRLTCDECGEPATVKLGFLLENYRRNPASSAYGKDDCSWCVDKESFSCDAHVRDVGNSVPRGCGDDYSEFRFASFPHMLYQWERKDGRPEILSLCDAVDALRKENAALNVKLASLPDWEMRCEDALLDRNEYCGLLESANARVAELEAIIKNIIAHTDGRDVDGKRRDARDDDACGRNWHVVTTAARAALTPADAGTGAV